VHALGWWSSWQGMEQLTHTIQLRQEQDIQTENKLY